MKQFLTDFDEPRRFLEIEDFRDLDSEPCGELDVSIQQIGAGGDSKFLPEVSTIFFLKDDRHGVFRFFFFMNLFYMEI